MAPSSLPPKGKRPSNWGILNVDDPNSAPELTDAERRARAESSITSNTRPEVGPSRPIGER
jgi:hypothetical protein